MISCLLFDLHGVLFDIDQMLAGYARELANYYLPRLGCRLFVATNADSDFTEGLLTGAGLRVRFEEIFTPDRVGVMLKNKEYYCECFSMAQISPESCIVVDNDPEDIVHPKALGARAVFMPGERQKGSQEAYARGRNHFRPQRVTRPYQKLVSLSLS